MAGEYLGACLLPPPLNHKAFLHVSILGDLHIFVGIHGCSPHTLQSITDFKLGPHTCVTGQTDYTDDSDPPGFTCLKVQHVLLRSSWHRLRLAPHKHTDIVSSHSVSSQLSPLNSSSICCMETCSAPHICTAQRCGTVNTLGVPPLRDAYRIVSWD